jgi:quercetin dioxygenase-like cupin family protein
MSGPGDRLSLLGRRLPPGFDVQVTIVAAGREHPWREADWRDALVVVERGRVEVECTGGMSLTFGPGAVLWLAGLPVRSLRGAGPEPAVLAAVRRCEAHD